MSFGNPFFTNWYFLYSGQTESERRLEPAIAALGLPYRSQHPFPGLRHIADFALLGPMLIIEVDGASHENDDQKRKDAYYTYHLKLKGWRVVRCKNEEAQKDPVGTVRRLLEEAKHLPTLAELEAALLAHGPLPIRKRSRRRARPKSPAPEYASPPSKKKAGYSAKQSPPKAS